MALDQDPRNQPDEGPTKVPEPTPDEVHATRMAADPRGRASTMIDVILRNGNPTELEAFCALIKPTFEEMSQKL